MPVCYSLLYVFHHGPIWGPELGEPLLQASPPPRQVTGPGPEPLCMRLVVTHQPRDAALQSNSLLNLLLSVTLKQNEYKQLKTMVHGDGAVCWMYGTLLKL